MKRYILTIVMTILAFFSAISRERPESSFQLHKHEFSVGAAFCPGCYVFDLDFDFVPFSDNFYSPKISYLYKDADCYSVEKVTAAFTASYSYNFTKTWALTASLSYEGGWRQLHDRDTDRMVSSISSHFICPMIGVRVSWLNRSLVRMYTSADLGAMFNLSAHEITYRDQVYTRPATRFSGQLTAVGISLGKKFFGYAEVGIGTIYVGGRVGVGYRF